MIIYFSGTGNSYKLALELAKKHNDEVVALKSAKNNHSKHIIFVFPTYAFDMPPNVKKFIEEFNFDKEQEIMGVSVSGGDNGNCESSFRKIIKSKGLETKRFKNVIMTDNSFPVLFGANIDKTSVDLEKIAKEFWSDNAQNDKVKYNPMYQSLSKAMFSKLGKKMLKKKVDNDKCIGCGICKSICPVNNIEIKDKKAQIGNDCSECFGCVHWCPKQAIRIRKPIKKENQYNHEGVNLKYFNK